jgi:hypothetical protein
MQVSFQKIEPWRYRAIRARIRAQAGEMRCTGDVGEASGKGTTITWKYDEAERELVIQGTRRPLWMTESMAASRIRGLVEGL